MRDMIGNIKIGSDPELFLINKKTGKIVSSIGIIPGVKGEAWRSPDMPEGYGLQIDNILAEFNIPPIQFNSSGKDTFVSEMNYMKNYIRNFIQKINPDLDVYCAASAIVDKDQLQSKEAKLFGCSPDYNVYTDEKNPKPDVPKDGLRSAGMHIHIGYDYPNVPTSLALVKAMDATLGLMSVILDRDNRRRSLYGKAGAFRLCDYGVEYRVLSSYFLSNDKLLKLVWDGIREAIEFFAMNIRYNEFAVQEIINTGDKEGALKLLKDFTTNDFVKNVILCAESGE